MTIEKVAVERFGLTSSRPFDTVVAALKSAIGQPDIVEFFKASRAANSFPDLERIVQGGLGRTGSCSSRNSTWAPLCVANPVPRRPGSCGSWSAIR
jgi:hypothetical protein